MTTKKAKRERESEKAGRARGVIGPFKYTRPDAWIYVWEDRDKADREYARALVRIHRDVPIAKWPEAIEALAWLIRTTPDPSAS